MSDTGAENRVDEQPREWLDSPWVWFGLFAAMGIIALLAVSPKYAQRQGRLEQRYENRLRMEYQRRHAAAPDVPGEATSSAPTRMSEARTTSSLVPIALSLAIVLVVAAILVWRRVQRRVPVRPPGGL